jgi:Ras-related GTP-binding protein A/B
MKKVPGTLYNLGITDSKGKTLDLNIWYRSRLVFAKTGIFKEEIIDFVQNYFEAENLSIPRNRLERIIKEELQDLSPTNEITFIESTVSEFIGEFQKKPIEKLKKIILMGLSNAGKTCIYERVFEGKKPWELMHSTATKGINYRKYQVSTVTKPMIWDLGGQQQYLDEYHGPLRKNIFKQASVLLYVVDAIDAERFENARKEFQWSVKQMMKYNQDIKVHVFFHKTDLIHNKDEIIPYLTNLFSENISCELKFHTTSVFDESLFTAWSSIIRDISPKSTFINKVLKILKEQEGVRDSLLIDKKSGLACGSTINGSNEIVVVGMISLLIVTCDKVTTNMQMKNLKEFRLKTTSSYLLLTDVNDDLVLVIILDSSALDNNKLEEVEEVGREVTRQLRQLWAQ